MNKQCEHFKYGTAQILAESILTINNYEKFEVFI